MPVNNPAIFPPAAQKRLGQNFLTDKNIQQKIIETCAFDSEDDLLEIGSGRGDMTALLIKYVKNIYAVEFDQRMVSFLQNKFKDQPRVKIIHADFLKLDIAGRLKEEGWAGGKIKVFGNIPYYITSPIIEALIQQRAIISSIFITVQKEFAERAVAPPGSKVYGSFSIFLQYYARVQMHFIIKSGSFFPRPKVDSAFLELTFHRNPLFKDVDEEVFFRIIRSAFNQRRKTLKNSLSKVVGEGVLDDFFKVTGLDSRIRPEMLSMAEFVNLMSLQKIVEKKVDKE